MITTIEKQLNYCVIETKDDLMLCFDDLSAAVEKMIHKTGSRGQSPEVIIKLMLGTVGHRNTFLLTAYDNEAKFQGFAYAMLVAGQPSWVDIIGIYTVPGVGFAVKDEVFTFLKAWGRAAGAGKIMAGITRSPDLFFKIFHGPLGFKKVGYIVEYDLTTGDDNVTG